MGAALAALLLVGCKPTEKGYQQAYDAALNKRQQAEQEQMLPTTGLLSDDGPQLRVVDGDSIYVLRERIFLPGDRSRIKGWSVAVGQYKMHTNATANAEQLRAGGYKHAYAARASMEKWFAIVRTVSTLDSAQRISREFRDAHREYPYVGLPGAPVIIGVGK